ncbi:MAG: hypothetical protein QNJ36_02895 [Calothrix sp. MO_167.B42]|nr:hypothetical protein [Calothrix sp. MO_167.B42]
MKDASNFGQFKKEIEEREKELAEINKENKPISFSFLNNDLPSNNDSLANRDLLRKIRKSQLEREIKEFREQQAKQSESEIKKQLDKYIEPIKRHREDPVIYESIDPVVPRRNFFREEASVTGELNDKERLPLTVPAITHKPPPRVSNSNFLMILFWLAAILLVISLLSKQGTNEEQQKNKQGYLQRNVPIVLDTQTASIF